MPYRLSRNPVHLGLGASAVSEPEFTGNLDWYLSYGARHASDGVEARLVSMHEFKSPWDSWEMHPKGSEVVICTAGEMTVIQEVDSEQLRTVLHAGDYVINPPGVWHTADIESSASAVFITAGQGTEHRKR